jgi:hypothetical protein
MTSKNQAEWEYLTIIDDILKNAQILQWFPLINTFSDSHMFFWKYFCLIDFPREAFL